jgi:hypothetical protein
MYTLFRKYQFTDKQEADTMITSVLESEVSSPIYRLRERVDLMYLARTIDPDTGEEVIDPNNDPYCVDILWETESEECPVELQQNCFVGTPSSHYFEGYTKDYSMPTEEPVV